ncbi:hypothetical protein BABA_21226 [Neobacillus bataviensis LMG 21833]|uniref:Uncharacterized protein n=1 Tax=Neobacillus bataviensis LMG 21833 TaxID=1117379 RepID=K6DAV8_9BACI|nr:DUF5696 domain-containing protein [Neobacillus bataviensis]EKN65208.1 hypothetical protein BABA_21226 [Neobacillus bataviensis LMG 21833]
MQKYMIVIMVLILSLVAIIPPSKASAATQVEAELKKLQMELVSENENLLFYMNKQTAEFAIVSKQSQAVWYSNPVQAESDTIATLDNKEKLRSQLTVRYLNRKVQEGFLSSYKDAVKNNQVKIQKIKNGVRVTYTLGKEIEGNIIPKKISYERMDKFLAKMSEDDQKEVLRLYQEDPANKLYILRSKAPSFRQKAAEPLFAEAGYTAEEYAKDIEENQVEEAGGAFFTVPVEYVIEQDSFKATIDHKDIVNGEESTLTDIKLLEYFGAADSAENGYLFVPDGSGALINFNNGKKTATTYISNVFGADETLNYQTSSSDNQDIAVRMPVFGVKKDDQALFAVITKGATHAKVYGDISGKTNSYNFAHAEFTIVPNGKSALQNRTGNGALQLYQKEPYEGKYQIQYFFLNKDQADYSGMARVYQAYLEKNGVLKRTKQKEDIPFYMEVLGGINVRKTFLGIPYDGTEVLTTYKEAQEMLSKVQASEIHNLKVIMNGWFNGGIHHDYPDEIKEMKDLNDGNYTRNSLIDYTEKEKIPLYFEVDFQHVYRDKMFDGFSKDSQATRYFDNTIAVLKRKNLVKDGIDKRSSTLNPERYILSSADTKPLVSDFLSSDKTNSLKGLLLRSMTKSLSSNFSQKHQLDREASMENYQSSFELLKEKKINLLGRNANSYAIGYLQDMVDIPMYSNEYTILDETVPFYQMVLKGYVEFAGNALNLTEDFKTDYLKAVESGAGLYFTWMYRGNEILKNTEFATYYSVQFDSWFREAMEKYKEMNQQLKITQNQRIIHHEQIAEQVYQTSYENGVDVYVNYRDQDFQLPSGAIVKAKEFAVEGGGKR